MQILSIFLKLQAVKQSGPGFLAYPVLLYGIHLWADLERAARGGLQAKPERLFCNRIYL